jgi:hypothetical protein
MTRVTLARAYASLFVLSTSFPVAASLMPADAISPTIGLLDVAVALVLVATGIYMVSMKLPASPEVNRRAVDWYKRAGAAPLVLLLIFFAAGSTVHWDILLVGLAWRAWLLMYTLPATLALSRQTGDLR